MERLLSPCKKTPIFKKRSDVTSFTIKTLMATIKQLSKAYLCSTSKLDKLRSKGVCITSPWQVEKAIMQQRSRPPAWQGSAAPYNPRAILPKGINPPELACECHKEKGGDCCISCLIKWWYRNE